MHSTTTNHNFLPFRCFATVKEGYDTCEVEGKRALPFVVRANADLSTTDTATSWPSPSTIRKQLSRESEIKGYSVVEGKQTSTVLSGRETLQHLDAHTLRHNVVDAESTRSSTSLLCQELVQLNTASRVEREHWLAYVVSPASNTNGTLHCDPPYGSNWQYLAEGTKTWHAVDNATFDIQQYDEHKENDDTRAPPDLTALSLLHDVYATEIGPGDFVSVPIHWAHSINTTSKCVGLSGYTIVPSVLLSPRSETEYNEDY